MNKRNTAAVILVVGLGAGLHLAFRTLAGELPRIFPRIANETPEEVVVPIDLLGVVEEKDPSPPPVPIAVQPAERAIPQKKLLRSSPAPLLQASRQGRLLPQNPGEPSLPFSIPPGLESAVDFWHKIYTRYDTHQVVFHDTEHLEIQYGVLDFTSIDERPISDAEKRSIREGAVRREMERIRAGLDKDAAERVRSQVGLRNRFIEGLQNSGKYLPLFEEIFENYDVPVEITRLAFVESLFKERAFSKVGAAGLWQFMPETAKKYMTVERLVDERYDPILATHAAARLLLKNYELLDSWPLAINAYNSGPGNLLKAVSRLGTKDIAAIVLNYRSASYAFASRNFYPQFLAALDACENQGKYFGKVRKAPVLEFDLVEIPATLGFPEIASLAQVSVEDLQELNPAFAPVVFEGDYSLPAGSQVRIPSGTHEKFSIRFAQEFLSSSPIREASTATSLSKDQPSSF